MRRSDDWHSFFVIDIVYSQPADTGTGTNVNTQLVYAIDHLKVGITFSCFLSCDALAD
jgi:hypothetical protein